MEQYETIQRELIEMLSKSFTFNDLESLGKDLFGSRYDAHKLAGLGTTISISPMGAAKRLVHECAQNRKLETLVVTLIQLDGSYLNDKIVKVRNLENLLYNQTQYGIIYDYKRRKFVTVTQEKDLMPNWGMLRDNKEYLFTVGSVDIVRNSALVTKHGSSVMGAVYKRLLEFLRGILIPYDGRLWSWQGDGGLIAFAPDQDVNLSVACCMNILLTLPLFNLRHENLIKDDIVLRVGLDRGPICFLNDTGKMVSETINYATHLEKGGTDAWGISLSEEIHRDLTPKMKRIFIRKKKFEGRFARSKILPHNFSTAV